MLLTEERGGIGEVEDLASLCVVEAQRAAIPPDLDASDDLRAVPPMHAPDRCLDARCRVRAGGDELLRLVVGFEGEGVLG